MKCPLLPGTGIFPTDPYGPPHVIQPLLSGWLILYRGEGAGQRSKTKFLYLKSTSNFGPL